MKQNKETRQSLWVAKNRKRYNEYQRQWRKKNPEKVREIKKKCKGRDPERHRELESKYRKQRRLTALIKYSCNPPKCEYGTGIYQWLKNNSYPKGFRVLCYNCNNSYGHYGYCPHKNKLCQKSN